MNILIRNLAPELQRKLEEAADWYGEKTASKTVMRLISGHRFILERNNDLTRENEILKKENQLLRGFSENIRYELSMLDSNAPKR